MARANPVFLRTNFENLKYRRYLHPTVRRLLNVVKRAIEYLLAKRRENEAINRVILGSMGLDEDVDISSLDAFEKKEFRKKKYMYLCKESPGEPLQRPPEYLFEYIPPMEKPRVRKRLFPSRSSSG